MASNKVGVRFTETMYGPFSDGPQPGAELRFLLTVATDDVDRMLSDPSHLGTIAGTVTSPALSSKPMAVENGKFSLFVDDRDRVGVKLMKYEFPMRSAERSSRIPGRVSFMEFVAFYFVGQPPMRQIPGRIM